MLSKEKLEEFRKILLEELNEIEARNHDVIEEMEHVDTNDKFHGDEADQATYMEERNRLLRLRDRDRKLINKIQKTIDKVDKGSYGVCESCGVDISEERLHMRPVAALCIDCKKEQEEREERDRAMKRR